MEKGLSFIILFFSVLFFSSEVQAKPHKWLHPTEDEFPESRFGSVDAQRAYSTRGPASTTSSQAQTQDQIAPEGIGQTREASIKLVEDSARKGVFEVGVIANDYGFFPKTVFVTQGAEVRLFVTGYSTKEFPACFMLDAFQVNRRLKANSVEEISLKPDQPGIYRFYCATLGTEGHLVVRPSHGE